MKNRIIVSIFLLIIFGSVIYFTNCKEYSIISTNDLTINKEKIKKDILNSNVNNETEIKPIKEEIINDNKQEIEKTNTNIETESSKSEKKKENNLSNQPANEVVNHDDDTIVTTEKEEKKEIDISNNTTNDNVIVENKQEEQKVETVKAEEETKPLVKTEEETKALVKTDEEINNELRKSIENQYGVSIKYGEEIKNYTLRGYSPTELLDAKEINENLNNIKTYIAYYPIGFFKEIKKFGMPLTIYLVKDIPNSNIEGVTDKEFYDNIKITICTNQFFFRVFHHEIYHYIEAYMEVVGYNNGIFNDWNLLNPEDFNYGTTNSSYSYSLVNPVNNAYFINDYGQTNDKEDRATIFEDLMSRGYELNNSYVEGNIIWNKGKFIAEEIDKYFNTVNASTTERWERFIYN